MCRVMKVLQEYISECDGEFNGERKLLPLHRYAIFCLQYMFSQKYCKAMQLYPCLAFIYNHVK